jgi:hypothetical protein
MLCGHGCPHDVRLGRLEAYRTSFPSLSDSYPPGIRTIFTLRLLAYLQNTGKLGEVDIVWGIVFSELQQPQGAHQNPDRMTTTADGGDEMDPWEEERSWRDPSAHRPCGSTVTWLDRHQQRKIIMSVRPVADARLASN